MAIVYTTQRINRRRKWLVRSGEIKDQAALEEYGQRWGAIAERFGAKVIARGDHQTPEGPHYPRVLIVAFPSYQQALACYQDSQYQEAMVFADRAFDRELTIIDGL